MMKVLAKVGFTQSYTYFTWRNTKAELEEYLTELTGSESADFLRPNLFVNTPDILTAYLRQGGPPAFKVRATLAATMSPSWGVYSGLELCERQPREAGSEEYLDSEKFQYRPRDWSQPSLAPYISRLNQVTRRCSGCATSASTWWTRPRSSPTPSATARTSSWWSATWTRTVPTTAWSTSGCPRSGSTGRPAPSRSTTS
jgi:hypothetical protein